MGGKAQHLVKMLSGPPGYSTEPAGALGSVPELIHRSVPGGQDVTIWAGTDSRNEYVSPKTGAKSWLTISCFWGSEG